MFHDQYVTKLPLKFYIIETKMKFNFVLML